MRLPKETGHKEKRRHVTDEPRVNAALDVFREVLE
jgi:hypothetical protein